VTYRHIAFESADDRVALVTLDRPDRLNAFTVRMAEELIDACDRIDGDDAIRAVVITGRGRAFCAGADLGGPGHEDAAFTPERGETFDERRDLDEAGAVALRIYASVKPWIAAINGPAVGVGITMTLPMDIRMLADDVKLGFVFARRGIVPEACSAWFLPRLVGMAQAAEWVFGGGLFGADEAVRSGLARSTHPGDDLVPAALRLARELSERSSPVAVAAARRLMWQMLAAPHPSDAQVPTSRALFELARRGETAEGVAAWLEKRPADFPLRVSRDLDAIVPPARVTRRS
jgi:enoyl-CoA hydratase/carnithine racemase